ncbi:MAG: glutamate--tRNA ligase [Calditrichia bacterium]
MSDIKVRFAPSPTGKLHVGGARTAIFNWLFARHYHGKFVVRIEDTDADRSSQENVEQIIKSLEWLGIDWDEDIVHQSDHMEEYRKHVDDLLESGAAYYCFCEQKESEEVHDDDNELPENGEEAAEEKTYMYDRTCLKLSEKEVKKNLDAGKPYVIRFKIPEGETQFYDGVHGHITIQHKEIEDFILLRSDGTPTYNLAVVVDDHRMQISHIIRGDDHIPNTPKQILLYRALGWNVPHFAHVPLIMGPDRKRLSKRHGASSIEDYKERGFLSDTLFNYLAQLGWSPKQRKEFFTRNELIQEFTLGGVNKNAAVFDEKKLTWMNGKFISMMPAMELFMPVLDVLEKEYDVLQYEEDFLLKIIELLKDRVKTLNDFPEVGRYFFEAPKEFEEKGLKEYFQESQVFPLLEDLKAKFEEMPDFSAPKIEKVLRELASMNKVPAAKLIHPMRLMITGRTVSPSLFEMLEAVGRDEVVKRMEYFLENRDSIFKQDDE